MKPKTTIMKKLIGSTTVCLLILMGMSFVNKTSAPTASDDQFIYLTAYAGIQNNSTDTYVSGMINYSGYDACNKEYITSADFYSDAGRKFLNYLENKFGLDKNDWKIQFEGSGSSSGSSYPGSYFTGFETRSEAQSAKDENIRKNDSRGTVYDTDFSYKCLGTATITEQAKPVLKSQGKAWWCTYYLKGTTMYLTKVYNNDCNHCQNEISAAFVKWLILNDYDHQANTSYVVNLQDIDESDLDERREEKILWYKQKEYNVINVSFTYTEN